MATIVIGANLQSLGNGHNLDHRTVPNGTFGRRCGHNVLASFVNEHGGIPPVVTNTTANYIQVEFRQRLPRR